MKYWAIIIWLILVGCSFQPKLVILSDNQCESLGAVDIEGGDSKADGELDANIVP